MSSSPLAPHRQARAALGLSLLAFLALGPAGCGGQGVEAPYTPHRDQDASGCPDADEALDKTRGELREGRLGQLGPHVERILVDDGGLRVVVPWLLHVLRTVPPEQAFALSRGYADGEGLARLVPHLIQVLDYFQGTSAWVDGEHYAVLDVLHVVLSDRGRDCDAMAMLSALRRALLLRVVDAEGNEVPWIEVFFDAVVELARDETFTDVLGMVEFDEEGSGEGIALGRDAFVLVARLVVANLATDSFDAEYTRGLVEDLLLPQLDVDAPARAKVAAVLDQLEVLIDPDEDIFPYVQATLRCANDTDEDGQIPGMIYDYLSIEDLSLVQFLEDLDAFGGDEAGTSLRVFLEDGVAAMEEEPDLTRDAIFVINRFLAPEATRDVIPALRGLQGRGVLTELLLFADKLLFGCTPDEPADAPADGGAP